MAKVVVIGGGASGIIAALKASSTNEVILLEKETKIGKKILITGNGKCNLWNANLFGNVDLTEYYHTDNYNMLSKIFEYKEEAYQYLTNNLGILTRNKDKYIYPYSNTATSVRECLERALNNAGIDIICNYNVTKIEYKNNKYYIYNNNNEYYEADKVVVSCGLMASNPSNDSINTLFDDLVINPLMPSLVPIKINADYLSEWAGVRADGKLSIITKDKVVTESGELQLTDYGISGIIAFNVSGYLNRLLYNHIDFDMYIDFMPDYTNEQLVKLFLSKSAEAVLETIFNYKLLFIILKRAGLNRDTIINDTNIDGLIRTIKYFKIEPTETLDISRAQVITGGISLNEIADDLSLTKHPNMYVTGELLDIDGICGGYNLASAFITGYIVGDHIND